MTTAPTKIDAILSLVPDAQVVSRNNLVEWISPLISPLTDAEVDAELLRLTEIFNESAYQRNRLAEYPDFSEYLDGVVKNDLNQIQAYIEKCLAVKMKYPKS